MRGRQEVSRDAFLQLAQTAESAPGAEYIGRVASLWRISVMYWSGRYADIDGPARTLRRRGISRGDQIAVRLSEMMLVGVKFLSGEATPPLGVQATEHESFCAGVIDAVNAMYRRDPRSFSDVFPSYASAHPSFRWIPSLEANNRMLRAWARIAKSCADGAAKAPWWLVRWSRRMFRPDFRGVSLVLCASCAMSRTDEAGACRLLEQAVAHLREAGYAHFEAATRLHLSRLLMPSDPARG